MLLPAAWMEGPLPLRLGWIPACIENPPTRRLSWIPAFAGMTGTGNANARTRTPSMLPSRQRGSLPPWPAYQGNDGNTRLERACCLDVPCPTAGTGNLSVAGFRDHSVPPLKFVARRVRGPQHTRGSATLREGGRREKHSHRIVGRVDTRCRAPRVEPAAGLRGARFGGALPARPGFPNPGTLRHHRFPGARRSSGRIAIPGDIR